MRLRTSFRGSSFEIENKERVKFKVVHLLLLSVTRSSIPMTMATTTAAMMPAKIGLLSGRPDDVQQDFWMTKKGGRIVFVVRLLSAFLK